MLQRPSSHAAGESSHAVRALPRAVSSSVSPSDYPTLFCIWSEKYGEQAAAEMLQCSTEEVERVLLGPNSVALDQRKDLMKALEQRYGKAEAAGMIGRAVRCTAAAVRDAISTVAPTSFVFVSPGREYYDSTWEYFSGAYAKEPGAWHTAEKPRYAHPGATEQEKKAQKTSSHRTSVSTDALPGTEEKIAELRIRAEQGLSLWADGDRQSFDDRNLE